MDFLSLSSEYESYKDYLSNANNTMLCLSNFFNNINQGLNGYIKSATNSLNELINSLLRYDHRSTHIKKFLEFSRLFERHLIKLSLLSKKISTELISPTIDFDKFLTDENSYHLMLLQNIINDTINQKKKYEKIKHKYFESCQKAEGQEKKLLEEMNKPGSTQESVKSQNEILTQLRVNSQMEYQQYKNEHKITNDLYAENNKKYFPLINILKDNEEKRINFLSFHLEKFIGVLNEEKISLETLLKTIEEEENSKMKKDLLTFNLNEDIKLYQEKFNFVYKPGLRFISEEIVLYDIYRRNIEAIINNNKKFTKGNSKTNSSDTSLNNSVLLEYNQRFFEFNNNSERASLDQNDSIIYKTLFDHNPLNVNHKLYSLFENKLRNDSKFASTILDKILTEQFQGKIYYQFKNKDQFARLAQVLTNISSNKDIINQSSQNFEINFAIIYIAERGFYYDDKHNRKYLCSELGEKCGTFKQKDYWKNLLIFKINSNIEKLTNKELKEDNKDKGKVKRKSKVQGAVKFLIDLGTGNSSKQAQKVKKIKEKKEKEVRYKVLISLIKDFVSHFPNFNLDMPICNDIVMEIGTEYNLEKDEIMYLISFINSNMYSIKNYNSKKKIKSKYLISKINDTNNLKQRQLLLILNSCFMFLYPKDYINLIRVNKFYNNLAEKTIFKHIFLKSDNSPLSVNLFDLDKHINMWFYFLKYNKKSLKYQEQKKMISEKNMETQFIDTINLDVIRTFFDNNQDENRVKLKNILRTLSISYPNIGYCQGMSYIGQFLLEITKENEERSFDIFSAILTKTNYGNLMINNFEEMKKYFYVFERLINIYLPDLDIVFRKNNVSPSYYITPWFITLFTHSFCTNHTKLLIRIFDNFILDGWICIIRIGLLLLKHYQSYLIEMKFEEILQFLINELKEKYDFFNNSNYDKFIELYHEMKIPKVLVINIENEFELNKKVEKIKQNYIDTNTTDSSSNDNDDEEADENDMEF